MCNSEDWAFQDYKNAKVEASKVQLNQNHNKNDY